MRELPCVICSKPLAPAVKSDSVVNQPWAATVFSAHGQYGSTVFDEMNGTYLEINICDECMREKAAQGLILHGTPGHQPPPEPVLVLWKAPPGRD